MQDVQKTLIRAMRAKLEASTQHLPSSIAMATPLGPLAEAAMEVFSGGLRIPTIPRYDPELAAQRRWYGSVRTDEMDEGMPFPMIHLTREGDTVVLHIQHGDTTFDIRMLLTDAADFGLSVVGAAYAEISPAVVTPVEDEATS